MLTWILVAVWIGGVHPAFIIERAGRASQLAAALGALFWPIGVGRYIAMHCYVTDDWRCGLTVKFEQKDAPHDP